MRSGVRCLLSPFLFNLVLELLVLEENGMSFGKEEITAIICGKHDYTCGESKRTPR